MKKQGKYYVYFYYDNSDNLLFIGKTADLGTGWKCHTEPWMKEVSKIGVLSCPDWAAMDILEAYFIVKRPAKYNVVGLYHGYTSLEIPGIPEPEMYSLEEFKQKFLPKSEKSPGVRPTIEERLRATGIEIIDIGPNINMYDEALLEKDLDRVCFRYHNYYLISRYLLSPVNKLYKKKGSNRYSRRTNDIILDMKKYFSSPTFKVKALPNGEEQQCIVLPRGEEERMSSHLFESITLFDLQEVRCDKNGEYLSNLNTFFYAEVTSVNVRKKKDEDACCMKVIWRKDVPPRALNPHINKHEFSFDLERMIRVIEAEGEV